MSVSDLNERVLAVLVAARGKPLKAKDISRELQLGADDRGTIRQSLFDLVDEGRAAQLEGRRFVAGAANPDANGIKGTIQRKASGVGWFVPDDKNRKDAFVPPQELREVIDGDVVLARIERSPRGPVATIVKVLEHTRTTVTGTMQTTHDRRAGTIRFIEVDDNLLSGPVKIEGGIEAEDGEVVEVLLTAPPTETKNAIGKVVRRIGKKGALDVEIERIVTLAGVIRAFPPDVLAEAGRLGENPEDKEIAGRLDLRSAAIVTIDGETAKDFDDAVYARRRKSGIIDVVVCVADVSHYVRDGAPLDREARMRATSIYYPGRVIPMLPEALSNGLCSLRPRVPRLCAVCRFAVDLNGGVSEEQLDFGVMQSRARLTYSLVQRFLDEEAGVAEPHVLPKQPAEATTSTADLDEETKESLRTLAVAATRLREARSRRGALDFELPELVIELDEQKEPTGLRHAARVFSQKLIEDLMIAANEASARYFDEQNFPSVYRIHEVPDDEKLSRFLELARPAYLEQTGKPLPKSVLDDPTSSTALMTLMQGIGEHPSRQALDMLLLRSMKQARYSVDNVGHYGLGSTAYLHFTSPIRRYPDLVVHRLLRARLEQAKKLKDKPKAIDEDAEAALVTELEDIALSSSERERKASDLERAIQQLHACWLMKDRVGEVHPATVTGVSEAGAFVRLNELYVDGLVRIDALGREYYAFDEKALTLRGERSREVIGVGTTFDVEVADVDMTRRQISFVRVQQPGAALPKKAPPPRVEPVRPRGALPAPSTSKRPPPGPKPVRQRPQPAAPAALEGVWMPRTDAVAGVDQKKKVAAKTKPAAAAATVRGRRGIEVDDAALDRTEGRLRSRQQRLDDDLAYEAARRRMSEGRATAADQRLIDERKTQASAKRAEQRARAAAKKHVDGERDDIRDERQQRYDEQQQRSKHRPTLDEETLEEARSRVRGPDDLRKLFDTLGPLRVNNSRGASSSKAPPPPATRPKITPPPAPPLPATPPVSSSKPAAAAKPTAASKPRPTGASKPTAAAKPAPAAKKAAQPAPAAKKATATASKSAPAAKKATASKSAPAAKKAPVKTATKKAPAKVTQKATTTKKAPAKPATKKAPAKPAKKAPAKKAPAKPAKKAPAKPAKKAPAKPARSTNTKKDAPAKPKAKK
jgi:ribonuclease R